MARQLSTSIWNSPALRQRAGNVLNVSQMHGGCSQLGLNLPDFACATVLDFAVLVEMDANRSGAICYTDRPWIQACSQNRVVSAFPTWMVTEALKKALPSGSTSICSCAQDRSASVRCNHNHEPSRSKSKSGQHQINNTKTSSQDWPTASRPSYCILPLYSFNFTMKY